MKRLVRCLSALGLALLFAGVVLAEDKKPAVKKEDKKPAPLSAVDQAFAFPKQIKLTDDQQKKLDELKKEYASKIEDVQKKLAAIMTPERVKAREEAEKQAKADGKKGKELQAAVQAALKLTDEEKTQMKEIQTARAALAKEIGPKKLAVLTDEQREQLKPKKKTDK